MTVTETREYAEGGTVYVLGGGILASNSSNGYLTGTGATTLVKLTAKSCDILSVSLRTGESPSVNLNSRFEIQ